MRKIISSSVRIETKSYAEYKKEYLSTRGFKKNGTCWVFKSLNLHEAFVNDHDKPLSQFVQEVEGLLIKKAHEKKKANQKKNVATNKKVDGNGFSSTDAMNYRLQGSYGSGKRR